MAMLVISWDLPPMTNIQEYSELSRAKWIPLLLRQSGIKEFRAYRDRYGMSPEVMVEVEFESLIAADGWLGSAEWSSMIAEMRALGCKNFDAVVWDGSPLVSEPLHPELYSTRL